MFYCSLCFRPCDVQFLFHNVCLSGHCDSQEFRVTFLEIIVIVNIFFI